MTKEELKVLFQEMFPSASFDDAGQWLNMIVANNDFLPTMKILKTEGFDYMFNLTCIDWKTKLTMVYHLTKIDGKATVVVKVELDRVNPEIETVCHLWRTAEFLEREVYEMFGVKFLNHPDLRLLILPDGWEGKNPLRKDYEDEINMVRL